ncbi:MAG TPA: DNA-binding domain-containing protein [Gammaproteobacteria bacterium]|nr:DNA-binding domain-containing protein [Gammaproteobacteria bacterium]
MSHLRDLQLRFQDYLIDGSRAIEEDIVSTENALAEHRLGTYYNAYRIRLIDALAVDFSALEHYLGRESFENLTLDYLLHHPSTRPSVRWFGQHLPEYLARFNHAEDAEFVHELAQYEWLQTIVFDAADSPTLVQLEDMAQIGAETWPALTFEFKTAMQWLDLYWNVPQIEHALDCGESVPDKQRSEFPLRWLLWRRDFKTYWRSLEVHEAWALQQAVNGANFADICEGLLEWIDAEQVALTAAGFLKQWISDQLVTRLGDF